MSDAVTAGRSTAARYCERFGVDERRARERVEQRNRLEALALRLRVQADESPPAAARAAPAFAPAPPPDILAALRLELGRRRRELHTLLAEALRPELESLDEEIMRGGGR